MFGEVTLWNVADFKPLKQIRRHKDSLYAAAISPDGRVLATSGYDQEIKLLDVESGNELHTLSAHNGAVFDLAFHPDGKILASASADRTVKIWSVETGQRLATLGQSLKELYAVAFSPDGNQVAAAGVDNRIRVWRRADSADAQEPYPLLHARFAHEGPIVALVYSLDGKTLVSSAEDGTVKLWNAATMKERHLLETQPDWPTALAVSPDSATLVVGRLDGSFEFYAMETGKTIPPPRPELASLEPRGVRRGETTKVRLSGKYLLGATAVESSHEKLAAALMPPEAGPSASGEELWIEVTPAADLSRGEYQLTVRTAGGTSEKLKFYVDDLPQVAEAEPNDAPPQATSAQLPAVMWGTITAAGDADLFSFEVTPGKTLVLELVANFNGVLSLMGPQGRVVASNNDFDGERNPLLALDVTEAGRYHVRVADLTASGSADHWYRLSAGAFPYVTGIYPLSVPADHPSEIELSGYNLPAETRVHVEATSEGQVRVPIDPDRFRSRREFHVVAGQTRELLESEPNGSPDQATSIEAPCVVGGRITEPADDALADVDLFRFHATAGESWIIETDASRRRSPVDTKIDVLDAEGKPVPRVMLQAVRDSIIEFRGIDANTGDVRVSNWEEMELNQFLYFQGEVCKIFRLRRGPDSGFQMYSWGGKRIGHFDTSATAHALDEPCYIVEPHRPGTQLVPGGLPVFTLSYANDDDGQRRQGRDSRLTFTAPADGDYLVRVRDVRGMGGDRFAYRLILRRPTPDFQLRTSGMNPKIPAGGGRTITFTAERIDGFDGPIRVDLSGLPPGFSASTPVVIQQGHTQAQIVLYAAPDAPTPTDDNASASKITATAEIAGSEVMKEAGGLGRVQLAGKGKLRVWLEPAEISIAPGTIVEAKLRVERNGFDDRISFELFNLPHGIIVDNIGLSGVLVRPGETERQIFLAARSWVPESTRNVHAVATNAQRESSPPVVLHVRPADTVAKADTAGGE